MTKETLPDWTVGGGEVVTGLGPELPPPPQAVSVTARPVVSAVRMARFGGTRCMNLPSRVFVECECSQQRVLWGLVDLVR